MLRLVFEEWNEKGRQFYNFICLEITGSIDGPSIASGSHERRAILPCGQFLGIDSIRGSQEQETQ
jgi:hypothetical protein